ncbi:MAG TPA: hypothetical protein VF065_14530, partial [Ilumatobacter sp.]
MARCTRIGRCRGTGADFGVGFGRDELVEAEGRVRGAGGGGMTWVVGGPVGLSVSGSGGDTTCGIRTVG